MLRGRPERTTDQVPLLPYPTGGEAFAVSDRASGVAFYKGRESFFLPYALLESMRFQPDKITLRFAPSDVVVEGRGMHALYVLLAEHKVGRVVEQGERHSEAQECAVYVQRIEVVPRSEAEHPGGYLQGSKVR